MTKLHDDKMMITLTGIGAVLLLTSILWLTLPRNAIASTIMPSPDTVIASWPVTASTIGSASEAMELLLTSRKLNRSAQSIGQVKGYLDEQEADGNLDPAHMLVKARLLQLHHQFDAAAALLSETAKSPAQSANALLLLANIQTQMGQFNQARGTCSELFGQVALIVTLTCTLDADFQSSPSRATYSRLAAVTATRATAPAAQMLWINETLASMALQVGEPELARHHLSDVDLPSAPVSLIALWMDTYIVEQNPAAVLHRIVPMVANHNSIDDAILLRLAIAEARSGEDKKWQHKMHQRVALREWREDHEHAAQLARYYLDVVPDKDKALHFASMHFEYSKTATDAALLSRAAAFSQK
ncbi:hypothetical protein [Alteromonas sp. H39]|uniref:hypothetical protein n=1 Tax=Alteromonas sp. H39 TaxID=3389876 RepID=UPI0039E023C2